MNKKRLSIEDILFITGIIVFVVGVPVVYLLITGADKGWFPPCLFPVLFGLYCPGCGGTRALKALCSGDVIHSFYYMPVIPYTIIFYVIFMVSQLLMRISRGKIKAMKYHDIYLYIALFLIIANWILKNVLKLVWNISM